MPLEFENTVFVVLFGVVVSSRLTFSPCAQLQLYQKGRLGGGAALLLIFDRGGVRLA